MTRGQYTDLISAYRKSGPSVFPHILGLGGMAIDTSQNRNKWRVPLSDLYECADQLKGKPLMKDHDIDHVDSIIGKVEDAWVEEDGQGGGKVMWKGECADESLIQKILLGYVKNDSIQIAVPQAYCDNCVTRLGVREEEAALDNLDFPCPRCGSLEMIARHPGVLEQSIIAIPAYENASFAPYGFKAALDDLSERRMENAKKVVGQHIEKAQIPKPKASASSLTPLLLKAFNAVANVELGVIETEVRLLQSNLEEEAERQTRLPRGVQHTIERMGGPEEWTPEPVINKDKKEAYSLDCPPSCIECILENKECPYGCADCIEVQKMEEAGGSLGSFPLAQRGV